MKKSNSNINIICTEEINFNRLKYTIDFINNHPLKPRGTTFELNSNNQLGKKILYSSKSKEGIIIPAQNVFFNKNHTSNIKYLNEYLFEDKTLYSVELIKKDIDDFKKNDIYGFDILETIFFHISRYEEVYCSTNKLDIHGRMKSSEQLLVQNKLHHIPVVDNLIIYFFKSLGLKVNNTKTTFSLTHDIDIIRKYNSTYKSLKSIGKVLQIGLGITGVRNVLKSIWKSKKNSQFDPYFTYDWLFVPGNNFKNKMVYFVAGGNTRYDLHNNKYLKELPSILSKARNNLYEIGYHPSYDAYIDEDIFSKENNRLNKLTESKVENIRTHYLRLDLQKTFEIIENKGFKTDSTLGYANDIGFRCGTGFEYYPYNFKEERAWRFKEIPLVFMDSSLIYSICNDSVDCFKEKAKLFFEKNKYNTHIMINFHNSTFDDSLEYRKGLKEFYLELIDNL